MTSEQKVIKLLPGSRLCGYPRQSYGKRAYWSIVFKEMVIGASNNRRRAWICALRTILWNRGIRHGHGIS
jgi:hypothetical protein